jgi:uncharacterized membrane protein YdbT with pleckstrin-like domain
MDLAPGERILFEAHPSWRSILRFYVIGLIVAAVAVAIAIAANAGAGIVILLALGGAAIVLGVGLLKRIGTQYKISDRRLWIRRGILSRSVQETRIDRVQNVNTRQGAFERLLGIGVVDFDTAAGDDYEFAFRGVADPEGISQVVDRAQTLAAGTAAPGAPPAQATPPV